MSISDFAGAPERMKLGAAMSLRLNERFFHEVRSRQNSQVQGDKAGLLFIKRKDRDSVGHAANRSVEFDSVIVFVLSRNRRCPDAGRCTKLPNGLYLATDPTPLVLRTHSDVVNEKFRPFSAGERQGKRHEATDGSTLGESGDRPKIITFQQS